MQSRGRIWQFDRMIGISDLCAVTQENVIKVYNVLMEFLMFYRTNMQINCIFWGSENHIHHECIETFHAVLVQPNKNIMYEDAIIPQ